MISIVLATCNGERFIGEQLESLLAQTRAPFEIIVSDDASTDHTTVIVEKMLASAPFDVRIHRNEKRLGFRENFLQACLLARGEFIAFCDQDDVWRRDKLEMCVRAFDNPHVGLVAHAADLIDAQGLPIGRFPQGIRETRVRPPLSYDPWRTFWGFSMVFRRSLLEAADINRRFTDFIAPEHAISHDRWIMWLGQSLGAVAEIAEPLVAYRQHESNLYGARPSPPPRDLGKRSDVYILATAEMLDVLDAIPDKARETFPLFDKRRCRDFLENALAQLKRRRAIYKSPTRAGAVGKLVKCFNGGHYRGVHDGEMLWRSIARDVKFATTLRP